MSSRTRALMVHYGPYLEPRGGGTKADRCILEHLARQGVDCTAIIPASHKAFVQTSTPLNPGAAPGCVLRRSTNGVDVHVVYEASAAAYRRNERLLQSIDAQIDRSPHWIFVTGSDRGHSILKRVVDRTGGSNVVYIVRATAELPMGPRCVFEDRSAVDAMARVNRILCASNYMARYIKEWSGLESLALDVPAYGRPPFPDFAGQGAYITIVNPCTIKGIDIFLGLAQRHPEWRFAGVPTWGTTGQDLARIRDAANVDILEPSTDIDDILSRTRVLLAPSMWDEAFGMIVVEAMLRGIPVLASDIGGLPEAKLGVPYLLPVRPIESYIGHDEVTRTPLAQAPAQDLEPWSRALSHLCNDPDHYAAVARASRSAAARYVAGLDMSPIDDLVRGVPPTAPRRSTEAPGAARPWADLSTARRAVLLKRLQARRIKP